MLFLLRVQVQAHWLASAGAILARGAMLQGWGHHAVACSAFKVCERYLKPAVSSGADGAMALAPCLPPDQTLRIEENIPPLCPP